MKTNFSISIFLILAILIIASGCVQNQPNSGNNSGDGNLVDNSKIVAKGDTIKVEYKGTLENGEEFDSTAKQGGNPLEFEAGAGQMIKGFDSAVIGMRLNQEKTITLKPEEAYGLVDEKRIIEIKKENIADFDSLKVGMAVSSPEAGTGIVTQIKGDTAIIDFNHPLAGKTLIFWIKIVGIEKA